MTLRIAFQGEAIWWRGPAPFVFVPIPPELSAEIKAISAQVTYGWGVIPVTVRIGQTVYTTSLFPKDGVYLTPIKVKVQRAEKIEVGSTVCVELTVGKD